MSEPQPDSCSPGPVLVDPAAALPSPESIVHAAASDSELSDIEDVDVPPSIKANNTTNTGPTAYDDEDDSIGEIVPDHIEGGVPVFKPTFREFENFQTFVSRETIPAAFHH
jgi:hypothetical protein